MPSFVLLHSHFTSLLITLSTLWGGDAGQLSKIFWHWKMQTLTWVVWKQCRGRTYPGLIFLSILAPSQAHVSHYLECTSIDGRFLTEFFTFPYLIFISKYLNNFTPRQLRPWGFSRARAAPWYLIIHWSRTMEKFNPWRNPHWATVPPHGHHSSNTPSLHASIRSRHRALTDTGHRKTHWEWGFSQDLACFHLYSQQGTIPSGF